MILYVQLTNIIICHQQIYKVFFYVTKIKNKTDLSFKTFHSPDYYVFLWINAPAIGEYIG